ncbi:unnamed protein product, partial [Urochloa humidicola]
THIFLGITRLSPNVERTYYLSVTMAKNFSTSAHLLLVLLVLLAFVSGILAQETPSRCSGARQESCPKIPGQRN